MFTWITSKKIDIEIKLDTKHLIVDYSTNSINNHNNIYIEGKVILNNPNKRSVWYESIQIGFVQSIHIDPDGHESNFFVDNVTRYIEMKIKKYISESTEFTFKLPISCKYNRSTNNPIAIISYINKSDNNLETIYEPIVIDNMIQSLNTNTSSSDNLETSFSNHSAHTEISSQVDNHSIDFDCSDIVGGHCQCCSKWLSSYHGESFDIKHEIRAVINSDWFTIYSINESINLYKIATNPTNQYSMLNDTQKADKDLIISIPGYKGTCYIQLANRIINIKDGIIGHITIRSHSSPIESLYMLLIKAEYLAEEPYESTLLLHQLIGEQSNEIKSILKEEPDVIYTCSEDNTNTIDYTIDFKGSINIPLNTSNSQLIPSFDNSKYGLQKFRVDDGGESLTWRTSNTNDITTTSTNTAITKTNQSVNPADKELLINSFGDDFDELLDTISVRYYIRLVVEDREGRSSWNTAEVYLYNSNISIDYTKVNLEDINVNIGEIV